VIAYEKERNRPGKKGEDESLNEGGGSRANLRKENPQEGQAAVQKAPAARKRDSLHPGGEKESATLGKKTEVVSSKGFLKKGTFRGFKKKGVPWEGTKQQRKKKKNPG